MEIEADIDAGERLIRLKYKKRGWLVLAATLAAALIFMWGALTVAGLQALRTVEASLREALALQTETLSGLLEKYRLLPPLLSRRDDIVQAFADPHSPRGLALAEAKATEIANYSGAKDAAFADASGRVFASARGIFDNSKLNESALLEAALQGRLGRESMSPDENERAYVFASAVRRAGAVIGVIAIYVNMDRIELTWALSNNPIAVADSTGRVFVANRADWRLQKLYGRPGDDAIFGAAPAATGGVVTPAAGRAQYRTAARQLPLMGWTLHVFADDAPVRTAERNAAIVALLTCLLAGSLAWYGVKRQEVRAVRQFRARATSVRLEQLVRERTADLTEANAALAHEVKERTEAEEQLRRTQAELIQAAKLAALGQMSATLSHEYNQPLAAIRTYADNGRQLIARGRVEAAADALSRIGGLVERMSELSRTLLSFARKPGTAIGDVRLEPVVDEALMLATPRARKAGIAIRKQGFDAGMAVRGGHVRLSQVVVNLVNNAIDALSGVGSAGAVAEPLITLRAQRHDDRIVLSVEDNGPGIAPAARDHVFEPFFSTKGVGEGLGIGLSIVYNIVREFGGSVAVSDTSEGGTRIAVTLVAAAVEKPLARAS
ncbi:sensor histidine kinase [Mesorhizobium xinjiangense]|uniref:sensor histidine kinase n=1 Tax=Mesorhizobium xinjiangense TaxID=2678685 RepID=UPI0018DD2423|nr:ATP-binding protein [Mesorhizobium xinjiangense]